MLVEKGDYRPMNPPEDTIAVNVVVEITPGSIQAIVEHAKRLAGRNDKGYYQVDTADKVSEMISRFLLEKDFETYVSDANNYK
jgi:hypothetical protein